MIQRCLGDSAKQAAVEANFSPDELDQLAALYQHFARLASCLSSSRITLVDSDVSRQDSQVQLKVNGELADHLSGQNFGDRGLGNAHVPTELNLRDALRFEQMLQHVGIRGRLDFVVLVFIAGNQITERIQAAGLSLSANTAAADLIVPIYGTPVLH